ncbi:MAG: flavin reductase family protein [Gemmatimonadota bacterium]|nr:flavin reductase family protein [Gemmatimonadota bacterium]
MDSSTFRSVLGRFATGVTVVTACDDAGTDHGMTVSAFCSLSLEPPLVLLCVEHSTEMHRVLQSATRCVVNILTDAQETLSRRFAEIMDDRFEGVGFTRGVTGCVILDDVLAFAECEVLERHAAGDHTIYVASVIAGEARDGRPLLYYRGGYAQMER